VWITGYSIPLLPKTSLVSHDPHITPQVSTPTLLSILHLLNNTTHTTSRSMGAAYLRQQRRIQAGMVVKTCE